jgi:hypothetical protein
MPTGWERLGEAFGSMGSARDKAYRDRLSANLTLGQKEATLKRDRMEVEGLEKLSDAYIAAGHSPAEADVLAKNAWAKSGSDYAASMLGRQRDQEARQRLAVVEAAKSGDWGLANAIAMGYASGPQELAKVEGDILLGNRFVPGGDPRGATAIGQSRIRKDEASAWKDYTTGRSAAARDYASAENYRDAARKRQPGGSGGSGGGAFTAPTNAALVAALGGRDGVVNPDAFDRFQAWREQNPQVRNGEEALVRYAGTVRPQVTTVTSPGGKSVRFVEAPSSGSRPAAPAPQEARPAATPVTQQTRIQQARNAIAAGKDPEAVRQMLGRMGIDPSVLDR